MNTFRNLCQTSLSNARLSHLRLSHLSHLSHMILRHFRLNHLSYLSHVSKERLSHTNCLCHLLQMNHMSHISHKSHLSHLSLISHLLPTQLLLFSAVETKHISNSISSKLSLNNIASRLSYLVNITASSNCRILFRRLICPVPPTWIG